MLINNYISLLDFFSKCTLISQQLYSSLNDKGFLIDLYLTFMVLTAVFIFCIVHMAKQHAEKVEQMNEKIQHLLKEKHEAYEDQFNQDVDYFKKHGKPGRKLSM